MAQNEREKLWKALTAQNYDVGSFAEFNKKVSANGGIDRLHSSLTQAGWDVGDLNTFRKRLGGGTQQTQKPAAAKTVNKPAVNGGKGGGAQRNAGAQGNGGTQAGMSFQEFQDLSRAGLNAGLQNPNGFAFDPRGRQRAVDAEAARIKKEREEREAKEKRRRELQQKYGAQVRAAQEKAKKDVETKKGMGYDFFTRIAQREEDASVLNYDVVNGGMRRDYDVAINVQDDEGNEMLVDNNYNEYRDGVDENGHRITAHEQYEMAMAPNWEARRERAEERRTEEYRQTHNMPMTEPVRQEGQSEQDYQEALKWYYEAQLQEMEEKIEQLRNEAGQLPVGLGHYAMAGEGTERMPGMRYNDGMSVSKADLDRTKEYSARIRKAQADLDAWKQKMEERHPEMFATGWGAWKQEWAAIPAAIRQISGNFAGMLNKGLAGISKDKEGIRALENFANFETNQAYDYYTNHKEVAGVSGKLAELVHLLGVGTLSAATSLAGHPEIGGLLAQIDLGRMILEGAGQQGFQQQLNGGDHGSALTSEILNGVIWGTVGKYIGTPYKNLMTKNMSKEVAEDFVQAVRKTVGDDVTKAQKIWSYMEGILGKARQSGFDFLLNDTFKGNLRKIIVEGSKSALDMGTASGLCALIPYMLPSDATTSVWNGDSDVSAGQIWNELKESVTDSAFDGFLMGMWFSGMHTANHMKNRWIHKDLGERKELVFGLTEYGVFRIVGEGKKAGTYDCQLPDGRYTEIPKEKFYQEQRISMEKFKKFCEDSMKADVQSQYQVGMTEKSARDWALRQVELEEARAKFEQAQAEMNESELAALRLSDSNKIIQAINDGAMTAEHGAAVMDYLKAKSAWAGVQAGIRQRFEADITDYQSSLSNVSHQSAADVVGEEGAKGYPGGIIIRAKLREGSTPEGRDVYVISGDPYNGSTIVVKDAVTGDVLPQIHKNQLLSVEEPVSVAEQESIYREVKSRELSLQSAMKYTENLNGEWVPILVNGQKVEARVEGRTAAENGEGLVVEMENGERVVMPEQDFNTRYMDAIYDEAGKRYEYEDLSQYDHLERGEGKEMPVEEEPSAEANGAEEPAADATGTVAEEREADASRTGEQAPYTFAPVVEGYKKGQTFRLKVGDDTLIFEVDEVKEKAGEKIIKAVARDEEGSVVSRISMSEKALDEMLAKQAEKEGGAGEPQRTEEGTEAQLQRTVEEAPKPPVAQEETARPKTLSELREEMTQKNREVRETEDKLIEAYDKGEDAAPLRQLLKVQRARVEEATDAYEAARVESERQRAEYGEKAEVEADGNVDQREVEVINELFRQLGSKLKFTNDGGINGKKEGDTIWISLYRQQERAAGRYLYERDANGRMVPTMRTMMAVAAHELSHRLGDLANREFIDFVNKVEEAMGEKFAEDFQYKMVQYAEAYKNGQIEERPTANMIREEVACDYAGRMMQDPSFVKTILATQPSRTSKFFKKILDVIREIIPGMKGETQTKMQECQKLWAEAYKKAIKRTKEEKQAELDEIKEKLRQKDTVLSIDTETLKLMKRRNTLEGQIEELDTGKKTNPAGELGEPKTIEEYVAMNLPKITPESFQKETGYGKEEQRKVFAMIAKKENGGVSVERAAEQLAEMARSEFPGFQGDDSDLRNIILDVLHEGNPASYVTRVRREQNSSMYNAKEYEMREYIEGSTVEELEDDLLTSMAHMRRKGIINPRYKRSDSFVEDDIEVEILREAVEARGGHIPTEKEINRATMDTVNYSLKDMYDEESPETLKYDPNLENYVDVIDEIRKKSVNLQRLPLHSFLHSDGLWREGLVDYVERLKKIHEKGDIDGLHNTEDSVRARMSNRNALSFYRNAIEQKSKREGVQSDGVEHNGGRPRVRLEGVSGLTGNEYYEIGEAIKAGTAELARREESIKELFKKYNVKKNGEIAISDLSRMFRDINKSKGSGELFDKVVNALGENTKQIYIANPSEGRAAGEFRPIDGAIMLRADRIIRGGAKTILHELLHRALYDRINQSNVPIYRDFMSREAYEAAKTISDIYNKLSEIAPEDAMGKRAIYGANNAQEMVADLWSPKLREVLDGVTYEKGEHKTMWQALKDSIKKLFIDVLGLKTSDSGKALKGNALKDLDEAVNTLLDNYSDANYRVMRARYKVVSKLAGAAIGKYQKMLSEEPERMEGESAYDYADRLADWYGEQRQSANNSLREAKDDEGAAVNGGKSGENAKYSLKDEPPYRESEEKLRNFKRFFGDWENDPENASKVVDEDGEPLPVYHWSGKDINTFDLSRARTSMDVQGFFFQGDPESSREYGDTKYAVYLNMRNPYIVDSYEKSKRAYPDLSKTGDGIRVREELQAEGYDGIIRKAEYMDAESDEYVVFDPTQIKSATDNNGEYNPENPDIRYSLKDESREEMDKMRLEWMLEPEGGLRVSDKRLTRDNVGTFLYGLHANYNMKAMKQGRGLEYWDEEKGRMVIDYAEAKRRYNDWSVEANRLRRDLRIAKQFATDAAAEDIQQRIDDIDYADKFYTELINGRAVFKEPGEYTPMYSLKDDNQLVWHGSAADFEKFNKKFAFTGEGSQAYGAGHYVTNVEGTGRMYADVATKNRLAEGRRKLDAEIDKVLDNEGNVLPGKEEEYEKLQAQRNGMFDPEGKRHLYRVEIPDDNGEKYLDWNEKLTDSQVKKIKSAAKKAGVKMNVDLSKSFGGGNYGVSAAYTALRFASGNAEKASEILSDAGFTGIKVPTGNMNGGDGRGMNYVVFNDADLRIAGHEMFSLKDTPKESVETREEVGEHVQYSLIEDPAEIKRLEEEKHNEVPLYRSVQVLDGELRSPMAAGLKETRRGADRQNAKTSSIQMGKWERSDENHELVDENGKITLDKGNGKDVEKVVYAPYIHTSTGMMNDQFSEAWQRPELNVVECVIPDSEWHGEPFTAEKAGRSTGEYTSWNSTAPVMKKLPKERQRKVVLSRWDKPTRLVPAEEIAQHIAEKMEGTGLEMPFNCVTPQVLRELAKLGVKIGAPEKKAGAQAVEAYKEWQKDPEDYYEQWNLDEKWAEAQKVDGVGAENGGTDAQISLKDEPTFHKSTNDGSTIKAKEGAVQFSLKSRESENNLLNVMYNTVEGKWAKEDLEDMRKIGDSMMKEVGSIMALHPAFEGWNQRLALVDKNGNPVYSVFINNNDTEAPTIELSRNCVKKEAMNSLLTILRNEGNLSKLDNISYLDLREILKKHGYDIACEMCYVESKRENVEAKRRLQKEWNDIANKIGLTEDFMSIENPVDLTKEQKDELNKIISKSGAGSRIGKIATFIKTEPGLRGTFDVDALYTPEGWDALLQRYDDKHPFMGFLASHDGSNTAKPTFGSHVFSQKKFMSQYSELRKYFGEAGINMGGFRKHSFSDADPLLFVDDYQVHENLALTKSGMFGYTKVPYYVDMWGETGEFINQSLVVDIDTTQPEAKKYAGLIKVGDPRHKKGMGMTDEEYEAYKKENNLQDGDWDYYFADESFPVNQAFAFRKDPRFGGRVGTVLVAPSDECILKALNDERIDTIIGYHASNKMVNSKQRTSYDHATDYTGKNETSGNREAKTVESYLPELGIMAPLTTKGSFGKKYTTFNYNEACQTLGDARKAAAAYLEWCDINGFTPMYEKFREHENYYKLLQDFRRYDNEGRALLMEPIKVKLPEQWAQKLESYVSDREEQYAKNTSGMLNDEALMSDVHKALGVKENDSAPILAEKRNSEEILATKRNGRESYSNGKGTNNSGTNQVDAQFSLKDESKAVFYSNAERAVEGLKQEKATPEQWKAMLQKAGGLKAEEDKWMGLSEWLDSRTADAARTGAKSTLTKQEVLDYIRENSLVVDEVRYERISAWIPGKVKGEYENALYPDAKITFINGYLTASLDGEEIASGVRYHSGYVLETNLKKHLEDALIKKLYDNKTQKINDTRLTYTTNGLKNKREIALVIPNIESYAEGGEIHFSDAGDGRSVVWMRFGEAESTPEKTQQDAALESYKNELMQKYNTDRFDIVRRKYNDSEWKKYDELYKEAKNSGGVHSNNHGKRVLVIDEIQSKRHQDGREKGYDSDYKTSARKRFADASQAMKDFNARMKEKYGQFFMKDNLNAEEQEEYQRLYSEMEQASNYDSQSEKAYTVPDAPFRKNWHELGMKRMLRYAAENGYDAVAWTTGTQQSERYNLSKHMDNMRIYPLGGGEYSVTGYKNNERVFSQDVASYEELQQLIGKDLTRKYEQEKEQLEDNEYVLLEGGNLVIGGEGMKGFYDRMLPQYMDKYGKKWGVKTHDIELELPNESDRVMHAVDVTPEMKQSVLEGQAMFSLKDQPMQKEGESAYEYSERLGDWYGQKIEHDRKVKYDKDICDMLDLPDNDPEPIEPLPLAGEDFTTPAYISRHDEYREQHKAWRARQEVAWDAADRSAIAQLDAAHSGNTEQLEARTREEALEQDIRDGLVSRGINITPDGLKWAVKGSVLDRRRYIEDNNLQDVFAADEIKRLVPDKKQRARIPFIIEGTDRTRLTSAEYELELQKFEFSDGTSILTPGQQLRLDLLRSDNVSRQKKNALMSEIMDENGPMSYLTQEQRDAIEDALIRVMDGVETLQEAQQADVNISRVWQEQLRLVEYIGRMAKGDVNARRDMQKYVERRLLNADNIKELSPDYSNSIKTMIYGRVNPVEPELAEAVQKVRDFFEATRARMENAGLFIHKGDDQAEQAMIQDYVTHIWDMKHSSQEAIDELNRRVEQVQREKRTATNSPYTRRRAIPTIQEGLEIGLKPKYDDICDIMMDYGHHANEGIANRQFIEDMLCLNVVLNPEGGEMEKSLPILVDASDTRAEYTTMTDNALSKYKVLKSAKPFLNVVFGSAHMFEEGDTAHKIGRFYDVASGAMKKINLGMSFFHHGALTETALGAMGKDFVETFMKNMIYDTLASYQKGNGLTMPALNDKEATQDAVHHFVSLGATQDYMAKDVQNITKQLATWLHDNNIHGLAEGADVLDFINKGMDTVLWDFIHDGFKIYTFKKFAKEIRQNAEERGLDTETTEKMLDEAGQLVNDMYGGQHWDVLMKSPGTVKWLQRLLLSPDWTYSSLRQALAPLGIGQIYDDVSFWKKWNTKINGSSLTDEEQVASVRKKNGRAFWLNAAIIYGTTVMALNMWNRKKDVEEQQRIAEERRANGEPDYKSPYELIYPEGMNWMDYTMFGNTVGKGTLLFAGRYDDGRERYIRWGKQFRELPELFFDENWQPMFPGPMINKIAGKVNPFAQATFSAITGYSLTGWENPYMRDKKGWSKELGRLETMLTSLTPFTFQSILSGDKEYHTSDLLMPSTPGFSKYKAMNYFNDAIEAKDEDMIMGVYAACVMNGLDAQKLLGAAIKKYEATEKANSMKGVETLDDALAQFNTETDVTRKKQLQKYITRELTAKNRKQFTRQEALDEVNDLLNGTVAKKEDTDKYLMQSTSNDLCEDVAMKIKKAELKKVYDEWSELNDSDEEAAAAFEKKHSEELDAYWTIDGNQRSMTSLKKDLTGNAQTDKKVIEEIRTLRREAMQK